ncbi:uncharacterized protein LOC133185134 [Saccostrea echinata]|uniref:uncharacterized protein LOC133185134 n=1 Tax=Saccostrea echinata TaxID=191078 RepID=UPI002A7F51CB|nr:uncharacterized protein LOC133185134 [Saccostrea echinata]
MANVNACLGVFIIVLAFQTIQSSAQSSDELLEIIHRQEGLLQTLSEKMQSLSNTVNYLRIETQRQERTIKHQSLELQSLRKAISVKQKKNYASSKYGSTRKFEDEHFDSYVWRNDENTGPWQRQDYQNNVTQRSLDMYQQELSTRNLGYRLSNQCAFYAYMNQAMHSLPPQHTLVFDMVMTNIANAYNRYTGVFTVPYNGLYAITWTIYSNSYSFVFSNLIVNSDTWNSAFANSEENNDRHTATGFVVAQLNAGDVVFLKTHETRKGLGTLESSFEARSTFAGWKIG